MNFGEMIPATTTRQPLGAGVRAQHLPNPPTIPSFTVRKFGGMILNPVVPEYGNTSMFGNDVWQLRLIFADWPTGSAEDFPVQAGDNITIPTGTYSVRGVNVFPEQKLEIYVSVVPAGGTQSS